MRPLLQIITVLFFQLAAIGAFTPVTAQQVKATARLDSTMILIGDQINLTLELEKPENLKTEFPQIPDTLAGNIEVMERTPIDTITLDDQSLKLIQNFRITCFDSGDYRIPPFKFDIQMGGFHDSIFTNELVLKVLTLEIDTTRGPADIKMPYDAPLTLKEVTPYIMGIILAGALLFLILYSIKRRKKNLPFILFPPKPKEPAHVIALRELDRIKEEKLWQKDKIKTYYSEVTEVLRIYIEERFGIPAMEQTTAEILNSFTLRSNVINEKSLNYLQHILPVADLVKFAKYKPLSDDNNLVLVNAFFFVNETKPVEAPKPVETEQKDDSPPLADDEPLNPLSHV